jgi:cyclophilin family peptidyl-prolyl cis-trans isomerase
MKSAHRRIKSQLQRIRDYIQPLFSGKAERTAYGLEQLEPRCLLAGDILTPVEPVTADAPGYIGHEFVTAVDEIDTSLFADAQGEQTDAPDLVQFAKDLASAGVIFFGADWCPNCTDQKQLFEDGADFLPFVEVTNPDHSLNQVGIDNSISSFPTWDFPGGARESGVLSLDQISTLSGVAIPQSIVPHIAPIADTVVLTGAPLHVPIDGYDPNGDDLTYTVSSDNPNVNVTLITGNQSAIIDTPNYGRLTVELFEQRATRATDQFINVANQGSYDGSTFHRIDDNFVIQGGRTADGSVYDPYDDDFDLDLTHNSRGLLSAAKTSQDDTNTVEWFVTDGTTRFLDYNHSVFGIVTEGYKNLDAIVRVPVVGADQPTVPPPIDFVSVFDDTENATIMVDADPGTTGTANITVTADDGDGGTFSETFQVTLAADTDNGGAFLADFPEIMTTMDQSVTIPLSAFDVEGDPFTFSATAVSNVASVNVDNSTDTVTVTPANGFVGEMIIQVSVASDVFTNTASKTDTQAVSIMVLPAGPASVDLIDSSDSGDSSSDNITSGDTLQFEVSGVVTGALVQLKSDGVVVAQETATGSTVIISTDNVTSQGDGDHVITAVQVTGGETSSDSPALTVTVDTTAPAAITTTAPTGATVNASYTYDPASVDENNGTTYTLNNSPTGMTISSTSGEITWSPDGTQVGSHAFDIVLTDVAGNITSQAVNVTVDDDDSIVRIRLETTDTDGNAISEIGIGGTFVVNVFATDLRAFPSGQGVFAAYLDILFDSTLASGVVNSFTFGNGFGLAALDDDFLTAGVIDEIGAAQSNISPPGTDEQFVVSFQMTADRQGTLTLTADPADASDNKVLIFGVDDEIQTEFVSYGAASIEFQSDFGVVDDFRNFDEDSGIQTIDVLSNDSFPNPLGPLTIIDIQPVGTPSGTLTVVSTGSGDVVEYTTSQDFFGQDEFIYTVSDGSQSDTARVVITIQPVGDAPTAVDDEFGGVGGTLRVFESDTDVILDALGNDLTTPDAAGGFLEVDSVGASALGGVVTVGTNKTHILYDAPADLSISPGDTTTDTFTYTIRDSDGLTDTATVTVILEAINDPPTANDFTVTDSISEDSVDFSIDVLANASTAPDNNETLSIFAVVDSANGTVRIDTVNQVVLYTPDADFFGTDSFTYTVSDGNTGMASATVTVNVSNVNDDPTANDDSVQAFKNQGPFTFDVLANDSFAPDPEETLTVTQVGQTSASGTVSIIDNGSMVSYTPAADFTGTETFTYTIEDASGASSTATVTVEVLDFTPRTVSGSVMDTGSGMGLGGVAVTLTGTDDFGETVSLSTNSDGSGNYEFAGLAPGSYMVEQAATAFVGTAAAREIVSGFDDGDSTGVNFDASGRTDAAFTHAEFMASTFSANSLMAAVDLNSGMQWFTATGDWSAAANVAITIASDFSTIDLTVTHTDGRTLLHTIDVNNSKVQFLGLESETTYLIQLPESFDSIAFTEQTPVPVEGEGELVDDVAPIEGAEGELIDEVDEAPAAVVEAPPAKTVVVDKSLLAEAQGESIEIDVEPVSKTSSGAVTSSIASPIATTLSSSGLLSSSDDSNGVIVFADSDDGATSDDDDSSVLGTEVQDVAITQVANDPLNSSSSSTTVSKATLESFAEAVDTILENDLMESTLI